MRVDELWHEKAGIERGWGFLPPGVPLLRYNLLREYLSCNYEMGEVLREQHEMARGQRASSTDKASRYRFDGKGILLKRTRLRSLPTRLVAQEANGDAVLAGQVVIE
jgi:hypothetical protein